MNVLEEVIDEALKNASENKDLIMEIKNKSKDLMIDDIFEISKIFVSRKGRNVASGFTIDQFKSADPEGYFNKIVKAFCKSLIDISQSPLTEDEKNKIKNILDNLKEKEKNV